MDLERKHLSYVDSVDIIDYVKKSVEILMSMREDEFENYNKSWQIQEQIRVNKDKPISPPEQIAKKHRTPKNSRFFAKIKREIEMLATPKTNKKRKTLDGDVHLVGGKQEKTEDDQVIVEYETCLQKLENDVRKHIRTEQQLKLHVEQTQV